MAVKDKIGRTRYIAFEPPQPRPTRHALNQRLGDGSWRLTVYAETIAILRVPHTDVDAACARIEAEGGHTVTTSGTIKQAKKRAGIQGA